MVALVVLLLVGFILDPGNEPRPRGGQTCIEAQIADSTDYPNC